jgi:hypothetical protein
MTAPTSQFCTLSYLAVHEAGHACTCALLGGTVAAMTILSGHRGAETDVESLPGLRVTLLVALAGHQAERLFVPHLADVRHSVVDYQKAFRTALDLVRDEEYGQAASRDAAPAVPRPLSPFTPADLKAEFRRLYARREPRAREIVDTAEAEVRGLLDANRVLVRVVAVGLEKYGQHLDAAAVAALVAEGLERQAADRRRFP